MDNLGYVVAGYLLTAGAIAAYAGSLVIRARRARALAAVMAARRGDRSQM